MLPAGRGGRRPGRQRRDPGRRGGTVGRGQGDRAVSWGVTRSDFGRDHRGPGPTRGPSAGPAPHPLFSRDEVLWPSPRPVQLGAWRSQLWESRVPGSQPCGCRRLWAGRPGSCWDRSGPAEWSLKGSVLPPPHTLPARGTSPSLGLHLPTRCRYAHLPGPHGTPRRSRSPEGWQQPLPHCRVGVLEGRASPRRPPGSEHRGQDGSGCWAGGRARGRAAAASAPGVARAGSVVTAERNGKWGERGLGALTGPSLSLYDWALPPAPAPLWASPKELPSSASSALTGPAPGSLYPPAACPFLTLSCRLGCGGGLVTDSCPGGPRGWRERPPPWGQRGSWTPRRASPQSLTDLKLGGALCPPTWRTLKRRGPRTLPKRTACPVHPGATSAVRGNG